MKRVAFNVNDYVRVKLTDTGREIHRADHDQLWLDVGRPSPYPYMPLIEDKNGWSRWQLWSLMQEFGPHITMGRLAPFETTIEIEFND